MTTLALRAYHLDHHVYPKRLEDLAPEYLERIPVDPFGEGQPAGLSVFRAGEREGILGTILKGDCL